MKTQSIAVVFAIASAGLILLSGCEQRIPPPAAHSEELLPLMGRHCTVQIKRDALGASASLPISPTTDSINGARVSVGGVVKQIGEKWLVLESTGGDIWIPRTEILLIQTHGE